MRLTDFLLLRNESDASFAEQIGVSPQALSRYKLGKRKPEWPILERIKAVTEGAVTPNDFLEAGGPDLAEDVGGRSASSSCDPLPDLPRLTTTPTETAKAIDGDPTDVPRPTRTTTEAA